MNLVIQLAWPFVALVALALLGVGVWRMSVLRKRGDDLGERIGVVGSRERATADAVDELRRETGNRLEKLETTLKVPAPVPGRDPARIKAFK